ncbi:hypothetical protein BD410DRAFT_833473 [Rickenella mellea]|uniref:Uncharacterized protein n=1 Tax=Rickenella mellea TaxID=50990 RepID=A0A4R5XDP7_9AGAM|nr:hypothetical protein BD410DRAFT_833473 [Rickenella mellea]
MEDAPVTLPAYPSFSLSTEASPESCCTFCTHQRRKQWKQIFRNGVRTLSDQGMRLECAPPSTHPNHLVIFFTYRHQIFHPQRTSRKQQNSRSLSSVYSLRTGHCVTVGPQYFASYKELAQPASNVVKAIVDQEFSAGEPATIVIWRNDVREVIQALKTLSDARAAAMRTAAWVADQREIYYAARPVRRRHSSLP